MATDKRLRASRIVAKLVEAQEEGGGCLSDDALRAIATKLKVPLYRVNEVVSFFPHFRRDSPPRVSVHVCRDVSCFMAGATKVLSALTGVAKEIGANLVQVHGASCLGRCDRPVAVAVNDRYMSGLSTTDLVDVVREAVDGKLRAEVPAPTGPTGYKIDPYDGQASFLAAVELLENDDFQSKRRPVSLEEAAASVVSLLETETFRWKEMPSTPELLDAVTKILASPEAEFEKLPESVDRLSDRIVRALAGLKSGSRPTTEKDRLAGEVAKRLSIPFFGHARLRILDRIERSGLLGKGGPGANPTRKWKQVMRMNARRRFVVCNADESEPGTFKDRELMLRTPELVVEGVILAALTVGAEQAFIYVRHEYPEQVRALKRAILRARELGVCGDKLRGGKVRRCNVEVFVSPGNYICGEQTALVEVIEGKRAEPRQRPPELEIAGLFGMPTLVNNVETLAWVPAILRNGPDWYASLGANGCKGMRFVSVSGDVKDPGVYEVPMGITVGQLLDRCGGMARGRRLKAFAPSGPSGGFLPAVIPWTDDLPQAMRATDTDADGFDVRNLILDNNYFRYQLEGKFMLGAAHIFYGDHRNMLQQAVNATEFYRNESCGKCVPCRIGGEKLVQIGRQLIASPYTSEHRNLIEELGAVMATTSICGLGQVAANPLISLLEYFWKDVGPAMASYDSLSLS